jgi:3-oxoacyl-[acyl-carrier protein] reductase
MDLGLKGKKALVMGASAGLGRGIAEALIAEGAQVAICARDQDRLFKAQKEMGATLALAADLTRPHAAKVLTEKVLKEFGSLDIIVVNTGGPPKGMIEDITEAQWQESFQSLWMAAVDSINAVLPNMKKNHWGRILLVTSVAAKEPISGLTISNGLRAGLLGLARSISHEVAPFNITINSLLPGHTDTERLTNLGVDKAKIIEHIPAGRLGTTKEFGALATFLASDLAGFITGQTVVADGGTQRGV